MQTRETSTSEKHLPILTSLFSKEFQQGLIYLFNTLTHPENTLLSKFWQSPVLKKLKSQFEKVLSNLLQVSLL